MLRPPEKKRTKRKKKEKKIYITDPYNSVKTIYPKKTNDKNVFD